MVSLVRLLVTLPSARLAALAERWGVTTLPADSLVAKLYHQMTDDWSVKRALEHLDEAHKALLYLAVDQRKGWTEGTELLRALPFSQETLETLLVNLRDWGLVAVASLDGLALRGCPRDRTGSRRPLVGSRGSWSVRWTCVVPRDLAQVIRRVREQATGEDHSHDSLRRMLRCLDSATLQRLALRWRVPRAERSFKRELVHALENRLSQRESVEAALASVDGVARELFDALRRAGGRLCFATAQRQLGLQDAVLHGAYDRLHELFLVHETYVGAERVLYAPAETLECGHLPPTDGVPSLVEVGPPPEVIPADDCLLDDLARLLARARKEPLRHNCQVSASERYPLEMEPGCGPPSGQVLIGNSEPARLHYMVHAGLALQLLEATEVGLAAGPAADAWLGLGLDDQLRALFGDLLADERSHGLSRSRLRGSLPAPRLRRRIAESLRGARAESWYAVGSLVRRVKAAYAAEAQLGQDNQSLVPGSREVVAMLTSGFRWLGVVTLGSTADGRLFAFQVTPQGRRLLDA